jgi:hypothetical protein
LTPVYGVNGKNALKDLPSFDPTQCLPPDCMHDVLEGVIPVTLTAILKKLISTGVLTVDVINERMSRFTYNAYMIVIMLHQFCPEASPKRGC